MYYDVLLKFNILGPSKYVLMPYCPKGPSIKIRSKIVQPRPVFPCMFPHNPILTYRVGLNIPKWKLNKNVFVL